MCWAGARRVAVYARRKQTTEGGNDISLIRRQPVPVSLQRMLTHVWRLLFFLMLRRGNGELKRLPPQCGRPEFTGRRKAAATPCCAVLQASWKLGVAVYLQARTVPLHRAGRYPGRKEQQPFPVAFLPGRNPVDREPVNFTATEMQKAGHVTK